MKRIGHFILLLLTMLALAGCGTRTVPQTITVVLAETEGCHVVNNGQKIVSGEDAVFQIEIDEGYAFSSVDYDGEYELEIKNGLCYVRLRNVAYPTRAVLRATTNFCTITYDPNYPEADVTSVTRAYDLTYHLRPNTAIGTDLFSRNGYTLTGWNTEPDGSGLAVGLGSRVSVPEGALKLYAQWAKWSSEEDFSFTRRNGIVITGYHGSEDTVVVPAAMFNLPVVAIASGAFMDCSAASVILPESIRIVEEGAFQNCALQELTLFDSIDSFGNDCFVNCQDFRTIHINAVEAPYGYHYRRESCFADKVDLLIEAQGQKKLVFYGGCSMWYNLDGSLAQQAVGEEYRIINMGVNGVINSAVQLQILTSFLEAGDIFFHTPELSSKPQLMLQMEMGKHDNKLWSGVEYNYDLAALVDLREFPDFLDSFETWLGVKQQTSSYLDYYRDSNGRQYLDATGSIPFLRQQQADTVVDNVYLSPEYLEPDAMERLQQYYRRIEDRGVTVYVSYACVNMDALPEEQRGNVEIMDALFRAEIGKMEGVKLFSRLSDYLYENRDFYDSNYHLLSDAARRNTELWLSDLLAQMETDGLWEVEQ